MQKTASWFFWGSLIGLCVDFANVSNAQALALPIPSYLAPGLNQSAQANIPPLTPIANETLSGLFAINPNYRSGGAKAKAKVVGAFEINLPRTVHLVDAWSTGYLPITLSLSDGRCFSLRADYNDGSLSNGRLIGVKCEGQRAADQPQARPDPSSELRYIGSAWGYEAWIDDRAGTTTISAPSTQAFQPLFTAHMSALAIMAMNSLDVRSGNVTIVSTVKDRPTVVILEVTY